jgi:hypothetical protein
LTACDAVLNQLLETQNHGGMVHEVSRYPTIFPSLHSILCASAAALFVLELASGDSKTEVDHLLPLKRLQEKLQISAEKLLSMNQDHQSLHPSILYALQTLKHPDDSSFAKIENFLFLLKRYNKYE